MSIVCGTDFSPRSDAALRVATRIAQKNDEVVILVHALEPWAPYPTPLGHEVVQAEALRRQAAEKRLGELAASVRDAGVEVEKRLAVGAAHQVLATAAAEEGVSVVCVGRRSRDEGPRWMIGSVTARLTDEAAAPVLVVRHSEPGLIDWLEGRRPLTVLVAISEDSASDAPIGWVRKLVKLGTCDLHFVHWYWPPAVYQRFGLEGARDWYAGDAEATALLERNLRARLGELAAAQISARATWGSIGEAVADAARDLRADLVVTGSHQRHAFGRFVHGSVSHDVLARVEASTVVVPSAGAVEAKSRSLSPRRILVPTDLSPMSNRAVPHAYGLLRDGGIVDLLRVTEGAHLNPAFGGRAHRLTPELQAKLEAELKALIPQQAALDGVVTRVHVVESQEPAKAIVQAAERFQSDLVCMSSHVREGLAHALLGSVAEEVMRNVRCPTLIVRTARA